MSMFNSSTLFSLVKQSFRIYNALFSVMTGLREVGGYREKQQQQWDCGSRF